jgi:nitrogen-specific signal transduction histidine kinase/ActR/RegA family two-component response regulator/HAMP domain-containing protein
MRSVSRKLLVITVGLISLAVTLAGATLLRELRRELYHGFESGVVVLARAVAEHCVAPLVFDDRAGAAEILAKLDSSTFVGRAELYDRLGDRVAVYQRPQAPAAMPISAVPKAWRQDGYLHVFEPVMHDGAMQGTLYLAASTAGLQERAMEGTRTVIVVGLVAIGLAALLAWLLQRTITGPILHLSETMQQITGDTILSTRVEHQSADEIGVLYRGFNRMLDQLADRQRERDHSEARLLALIAALPDPVFVLDEHGRMVEVLAGRPELHTVSIPALHGRTIGEVLAPERAPVFEEAVGRALCAGTPQRLAYEVDLSTGKRWFDAVLVPIARVEVTQRNSVPPGVTQRNSVPPGVSQRNSAPPGSLRNSVPPGDRRLVLFVPRDVTERHTLELDLRQAQKMEALGRLAGGVAHDFNNILTAILGYAVVLERRLQGTDRETELECAREILQAGERAKQLTKQLLAFSRRQVVVRTRVSLNKLVGEMQRMLERIIGEDVNLVADLAPSVPPVEADPGQLQQVILNLAVNARDAMPNGGTVTLRTRVVSQTVRRAGDPEVPAGTYVLFEVSDSGVGMDEAVRARIFEPFFTTKGGTGLGLAMVYGIVRQAGGDVTVHSEPGEGSVFHIYLPVATPSTDAVEQKRAQGQDEEHGQETILLVEDEQQIRQLTLKLLRDQGYNVLVAPSAEDALKLCRSHPEPIHLLLTDVVMPRTGGVDLVQAAQPLRPEMSVLYMSGYTDNEVVLRGVALDHVPFLQKPFAPDELQRKVREVLSSDRGRRV